MSQRHIVETTPRVSIATGRELADEDRRDQIVQIFGPAFRAALAEHIDDSRRSYVSSTEHHLVVSLGVVDVVAMWTGDPLGPS